MRHLVHRILMIPPLVLVVATLAFFLMRLAPGGPFDRERVPASKEVEAALLAKYHLDKPLWVQYGHYVRDLLRGDLGPSLKYRNHSVNDILKQTIPVSLTLGMMAFGVALGIGVPGGFYAAVHRGKWPDWGASFLVLSGICVPSFVIGPLLILVFGLQLGWLPVAMWGSLPQTILPTFALGLFFAARISRLVREGMTEALQSPFIQTARAKGLPEQVVLVRHALRIAILPTVSYTGPMLADLLTGSFVIENIFQIPGTGVFFINSFFSRDYTMMVGMVILYSMLLLVLNLLVDLAYTWLDPRVRYDTR